MKNFNLEIPKFYITAQLFLHKAPTFKTIKLLRYTFNHHVIK